MENKKSSSTRAKIRVLGIGGGGGNAINNMIHAGLEGVDFITANTDFQALDGSLAATKIQLGTNMTKGLGAGGNPEVGAKATQEDMDKIREVVEGSDMVFVTAGMGGGTGTGGTPVAAQVCKDLGILTVAVVTKPFNFEGRVRQRNAENGIKSLEQVVDTLITIPNDRLVSLAAQRATLLEMFKRADDVLLYAVKGISDLITHPGYINVDFADLKTVMSEMGMALMGTGVAQGENRAVDATQQAISSPLLEDISIHGARAVLINICAGLDLGMHEMEEALSAVHNEADEDAVIIVGTTFDPNADGEMRVTVIATGIERRDAVPRKGLRKARNRPEMATSKPQYDYLQIPAVVRQRTADLPDYEEKAERKKGLFRGKFTRSTFEEEDLNIPTFIRRQAD